MRCDVWSCFPAVMVGGGLWLGVLDWVMGWRSLHWHWSVRLWSRFDISGRFMAIVVRLMNLVLKLSCLSNLGCVARGN
jgi:hypothetical protein